MEETNIQNDYKEYLFTKHEKNLSVSLFVFINSNADLHTILFKMNAEYLGDRIANEENLRDLGLILTHKGRHNSAR